jgi:hypothetical protein
METDRCLTDTKANRFTAQAFAEDGSLCWLRARRLQFVIGGAKCGLVGVRLVTLLVLSEEERPAVGERPPSGRGRVKDKR